ncbi:MAG: UDP-N-acetylmuramyl-tripeptide synthetase, partial [Flavobacteriales bacterium]|nr:UDP-N-acetylmuramyl-tripeptide synthetase [Flavobacteriales bacterium]
MKILADILYKCRIKEVIGTTNIAVESIHFDSRKAVGMSLFVAVRGTAVDGHLFIDKAIENGATAVVCEYEPETLNENITYVIVKDSASALGEIASNFYDNPSEKIQVIGITGTNGKTTTVTLLFELFRSMGKKAGLLSTVVNRIGDTVIDASLTTPDAVTINRLLAEMIDAGCKYCFMEASSHAIHQERIAGIKFRGAVFTNITHDHLDYHQTFNEYIKAKKQLFDRLSVDAFALVNEDDAHGEIMVQNSKAKVKTFGLKT